MQYVPSQVIGLVEFERSDESELPSDQSTPLAASDLQLAIRNFVGPRPDADCPIPLKPAHAAACLSRARSSACGAKPIAENQDAPAPRLVNADLPRLRGELKHEWIGIRRQIAVR